MPIAANASSRIAGRTMAEDSFRAGGLSLGVEQNSESEMVEKVTGAKRRGIGLALGILATIVGSGCAEGAENTGQAIQLSSPLPDAGFVPIPILTTRPDPVDGQPPSEPILGVDGAFQSAWDGSVADLVAADAYADCVINGSAAQYPHPILPSGTLPIIPGNDEYLEYLWGLMESIDCNYDFPDFPRTWQRSRTDPACNVDAGSGLPAAVEFGERGPDVVANFREVIDMSDAATYSSSSTVFAYALHTATRELQYADLNLCMAQRLHSQMNGGQTLFLSTEDQVELLGIIRERAQLAVIYHSLIAKVLASSGSLPTITAADYQFPILIRAWAAVAQPAVLQALGENYAVAVQTHIKSTLELAQLLQRDAGTRPTSGDVGSNRADRDWGLGQPRMRVMNLLYGGDPIGSTVGSLDMPGRGVGGRGRSGPVPAYVSENMSDPRIGVLLGLAKSADALYFKVANTEHFNDAPGFDAVASASRLYATVEAQLRRDACDVERSVDDWCGTSEASTAANSILPDPRLPSCNPPLSEDLGCDAPDVVLPDPSNVEEYLLWQRYRIAPSHATILAEAISQSAGDLAKTPTGGIWRHRLRDGLHHVTGTHETVTLSGAVWVHFDADAEFLPFEGHELLIDFAQLPYLPRDFDLSADARQQGFVFEPKSGHGSSSDWTRLRELGAVGALAFAREAIVQGSAAGSQFAPFFSAAADVLNEIDRATGQRTVIIRPERITANTSCLGSFVSGSTCKTFVHATGANPKYRVDVTTREEDPLDELVTPLASKQLHTVAIRPDTVGIDGYDRTDLDGETPIQPTTSTSYTSYASDYRGRTFLYELPNSVERAVLLRGDAPNGVSGDKVYMYLFGHGVSVQDSFVTSFGGSLHRIGERTMRVMAHDWSRPKYDPFGFPIDWVPPADASLVGGTPGEPAYQYYLRSAESGAQEATAAVQQAVDSLVEETLYKAELDAAEERASTITDLEAHSLCGSRANCNIRVDVWEGLGAALGTCTQAVEGFSPKQCTENQTQLERVVADVRVAREVLQAPDGVPPSALDLTGSEMERVLLRQWNALQGLKAAIATSVDTARSADYQTAVAGLEYLAASAELTAARANIEAELAQLDQNETEIAVALNELDNAALQYEETLGSAQRIADRECDAEAFRDARKAGWSYSDPDDVDVDVAFADFSFDVDPDKKAPESWSSGALYAQLDQCFAALDAASAIYSQQDALESNRQARTLALLDHRNDLLPLQRAALVDAEAAALRRWEVSRFERRSVSAAVLAQVTASALPVQQARGELAAAVAEMQQIRVRLKVAKATANLERDLTEKNIAIRFGLQRKYRSYDMWRAQALLESSRRLSVAARRAIEAHFVVDLSDVTSSQAFVEAPSVWVDEVYAADLQAAAVVGLSVADSADGTVNPNQLLDYVGNLERFVQGYTVTYPTSVALPDTEVLLLPGPETVRMRAELVDGVATGEDVSVLEAANSNWVFVCAGDDRWVPHPGVGQAPLVDTLATMCSGQSPSRMKIGFALDAWGRLDRSVGSEPLTRRHNVRWRRLAVNLLGTGIRDCSTAVNSQACYSEGFLDFQMSHHGPSWASNHSGNWRAYDLPTASIEDGKALALEEWLDPVSNSWETPFVSNVARGELFGRPVNGSYELIVELPPDVRPGRIEGVQLLVETDYWVTQQ